MGQLLTKVLLVFRTVSKLIGGYFLPLMGVGAILFLVFSYNRSGFLLGESTSGQVDVFFEGPSELDSEVGDYLLVLDAGPNKISFVRLVFEFDKEKVNLAGEIQTTDLLKTVVQKTSAANANENGRVEVVLGLSPDDKDNPPTGVFSVINFPLISISPDDNDVGVLSLDVVSEDGSQVVDDEANEMTINSQNFEILLNPLAEPSPTPTPTSMPSPTPTLTPTPTPTTTPDPDSATLSLVKENDEVIFVDEAFGVNLDLWTNAKVLGVDAVVLFDPEVLEALSVESKNLLKGNTISSINNDTGVVRVSQVENPGDFFEGEGSLAVINFRAQKTGETTLLFEYEEDKTHESNVISSETGEDILLAPESLILEISSRVYLQLKLLTASRFGHDVSGIINIEGGDWQENFVTNTQGESEVWELDHQSDGQNVSFHIKVSGYLRRKVSLLIGSGENLLNTGRLKAGDLNDDGIVNNIDLALMYEAWSGSGLADFNRDGIVNSSDYFLLVQNFLETDE